ncbi:delta-type opioid receptor-like [Dendronephthya gigantea]|uniref:delta-type opioid receptor-like n=1 Tax=Dendronephthya gigantea TaxID=151771 RepID=UPI00106D67B9|nr:delta-type opioid receptor-like [Dendronephthya gigantea]
MNDLDGISTPAWESTMNTSVKQQIENGMIDIELVFLVFAFIMVAVGLVGNVVIIISGLRLPMTRKKGVTTGSRYYIINLASADLCVLIVYSVTDLTPLLHPWGLGDFMCKALLPLRDVFLIVSLVTITTLSLERYWLITRPLQHQGNKSIAKVVLVFIWIASYLVNGLPLLLLTRLVNTQDGVICMLKYPSVLHMKVHVGFGIAIILIPFLIVTFCYVAIGITLQNVYKKHSQNMLHGYDEAGNKHTVTLILRSKRLVKVLIVLLVAFAICNLPVVLYVLAHFFYKFEQFEHQKTLYTFFQCMMVYGSGVNPLILLLMASEYRLCIVELKEMLRKLCTGFCGGSRLGKERPDQPYCAMLQDKNIPTTPV